MRTISMAVLCGMIAAGCASSTGSSASDSLIAPVPFAEFEGTDACPIAETRVRPDEPPMIAGGLGLLHRNLRYPESALGRGHSGMHRVTLTIDREGDVVHVQFENAPYQTLRNAVLEAIDSVDYIPARLNGEAVCARLMLPINFRERRRR